MAGLVRAKANLDIICACDDYKSGTIKLASGTALTAKEQRVIQSSEELESRIAALEAAAAAAAGPVVGAGATALEKRKPAGELTGVSPVSAAHVDLVALVALVAALAAVQASTAGAIESVSPNFGFLGFYLKGLLKLQHCFPYRIMTAKQQTPSSLTHHKVEGEVLKLSQQVFGFPVK